jgi:hypothetical protein
MAEEIHRTACGRCLRAWYTSQQKIEVRILVWTWKKKQRKLSAAK